MNKHQFEKLRSNLSSFCRINFYQYSDMSGNKPTGLFCSSYSEISKDYVMQKVRDVIDSLKFNFVVDEGGYEKTKHFIIKF